MKMYEMAPGEIYKFVDKIVPSEHHISIPALQELASAAQQKMIDLGWKIPGEQESQSTFTATGWVKQEDLIVNGWIHKADLLSDENVERVAQWLKNYKLHTESYIEYARLMLTEMLEGKK